MDDSNWKLIVTTFGNLLKLLYRQSQLEELPSNKKGPHSGIDTLDDNQYHTPVVSSTQMEDNRPKPRRLFASAPDEQESSYNLKYSPPQMVPLIQVEQPTAENVNPNEGSINLELSRKCNEIIERNPWLCPDLSRIASNDTSVEVVMADFIIWVVNKYVVIKRILLCNPPLDDDLEKINKSGPNIQRLAKLMMEYRSFFTTLINMQTSYTQSTVNSDGKSTQFPTFEKRLIHDQSSSMPIQSSRNDETRESQLSFKTLPLLGENELLNLQKQNQIGNIFPDMENLKIKPYFPPPKYFMGGNESSDWMRYVSTDRGSSFRPMQSELLELRNQGRNDNPNVSLPTQTNRIISPMPGGIMDHQQHNSKTSSQPPVSKPQSENTDTKIPKIKNNAGEVFPTKYFGECQHLPVAYDPKKPDNADIVMELVATLGKAIEIGSSGVLSNDDKSMFTNHVGRVTNTFLLRKAQQQQTKNNIAIQEALLANNSMAKQASKNPALATASFNQFHRSIRSV